MNRSADSARCLRAGLILALASSLAASADPPVRSNIDLPAGFFCIRVTDVECTPRPCPADPGAIATFDVEFEILNWSASNVARLDVWVTDDERRTIELSNAWVDENGRPLGDSPAAGTDGCTLQPDEGPGHTCYSSPPPGIFDNFAGVACVGPKFNGDGMCGRLNNWKCTTTPSMTDPNLIDSVTYLARQPDDYLPTRDVLNFNANTTAQACDLIPGCTISATTGLPLICGGDVTEALDNGTDTDGSVDNVLDGFVIQIANATVGEHISLNWATYDSGGYSDPAFGRGMLSLYLHSAPAGISPAVRHGGWKDHRPLTSEGPALWTGPAGSNVGTSSHHRDIAEPTTDTGHHFEVEVGVGLTAPGVQPPPGSPAADAVPIVAAAAIPTLSLGGLILMVSCLMALGYFLLRR